jgi:UDP-N-acetylmuramoylalanine--D-glutamate ligase
MEIGWFRDKKATVMGLGLHGGGLATAKWLLRHGARVTVTDMKDAAALAPSVEALDREYAAHKADGAYEPRYVLGRHEESDFTGADVVFQNPDVRRGNQFIAAARAAGVPIETDISVFFALCPFPIIGVSGTKGKTTTTALIGEMCKAMDPNTVVAGNIRLGALDALDGILAGPAKPRPVVLELSSWQLEGLGEHGRSPHIAVLTNIKQDHLNRYRDMDDYAAAKELLVANQTKDDIAVLNRDDERVRAIGARIKSKALWFSMTTFNRGDGCLLRGDDVVLRLVGRERDILRRGDIQLKGEHNVPNVLAACAAAAAAGVPHKTIKSVVRRFKGVPGRLEEVRFVDGVTYVNDTTATAPDASIAAMRTYNPGMSRRIVLIAGGADKELDFGEWAKEAAKRVKHLVLFPGAATEKMRVALEKVSGAPQSTPAASMEEAVDEARSHAVPGDVVLLSPGCASFGLFSHEFDRGDQFVAEVKRLGP